MAAPGNGGPPRRDCGKREEPAACRISGDPRRGFRLHGTLLLPDAVRSRATLDVDAAGIIRCADCDCGEPGDALVIDCPGLIVSPGMLNLHDHLTYAGTAPVPHPGERYEHRNDWRLGENGHAPLVFSGGAKATEVLAHELRSVMSGVTSVVGAGGRRGLLRNLDTENGSEGLFTGRIRAETFPLDDARGDVDSAACSFGPRPDTAATVADAQAYIAHLGEGTNQRAADELRCALGHLDIAGENSAVVHAMALTRGAAEALAKRGASVVWSPRSNLDLYGTTAPVALLSSLGVRVALGTDWLASGSMNLQRELSCARAYDDEVLGSYLGPFQLWRMVTENAAWALGLEGRIAALRPGAAADLAVFAQRATGAHASVVEASPEDVKLVLRGGAPLYGDAELVAAFDNGEACEQLDVCGVSKRACTLETGFSLSELRAAGEAIYPLFSCAAPPNEPNCSASTERECPLGEASCEAPPPAPAWNASDADGDTVPDTFDVCPRAADPQQLDTDRDGRGDVCDACPLFNPGLLPCQRRVAELRSPGSRLPAKSAVWLQGVRVTALLDAGSKGYYVEDGDHRPYSGLFVYTGDTKPKVSPGDLLDIQGYFETYQGTDELVGARVLSRSPAQDQYEPLLVASEELSDEGAEPDALASLFVRVADVRVALQNPDYPKDYDETQLDSGLRIDDLLRSELDNSFDVGKTFESLRGIAGFSFGHHKLYLTHPEDWSH